MFQQETSTDVSTDVIEKMHWYEQPEKAGGGEWKKHKWALVPYGGGGAQIELRFRCGVNGSGSRQGENWDAQLFVDSAASSR